MIKWIAARRSGDQPEAQDVALLAGSALFDPHWWQQQVNLPEGTDPVLHHMTHKASPALPPSPYFDAARYLGDHPDVAGAGVNPLLHYLKSGRAEGRRAYTLDGRDTLFWWQTTPDRSEAQDPSHYGADLDALVQAGRAVPVPDATAEHATLDPEFDAHWYLSAHEDVAATRGINPVDHYVTGGAREGRRPAPWFSDRHYLAANPELADDPNTEKVSTVNGRTPFAHWLESGRAEGRIGLPYRDFAAMAGLLDLDPAEAQDLLLERQADLRQRLTHGTLGQMVERAARLDPQIALGWPAGLEPRLLPFHSDDQVSRITATHALHHAAGFARARAVILVNRPRWGGARRMEGHLAHALVALFGPEEVVVISTDQSGAMPKGKLPDGVRHVDFHSLTRTLPYATCQRMLFEFLRALRPGSVFNVNSRLTWDILDPYGLTLGRETRLFAVLFCNDKTRTGHWIGYPSRYFYRHVDKLAGVCTDSAALRQELSDQFLLPETVQERLHVLRAPVNPELDMVPDPTPADQASPPKTTPGRPQIYWAGRFDPQKRVDVVYALARALPEADIHMWGEPVQPAGLPLPPKPDNVVHRGVYARFEDLPLREADLWLYTSEWDGVPSILLEVAMTGLPIVGAAVGGTPEILHPDLSWPVSPHDDAEAYARAIRDVLADPGAARTRAHALRTRLSDTRTEAAFQAQVAALVSDAEFGS